MNEIYTLTVFLDRKYVSSVKTPNKKAMIDLLNSTDNNMKDFGYKRVSTEKVRINKPDHTYVTNYSLCYTRI